MHPSNIRRSILPLAWSRTSATICGILILALQPVIFYWRVLINPSEHIPYDLAGFHLPLISYVAQCVRQGIAPLWDPYPYCGAPIHADIQAQVFYPFTWVAILAGNHSQGRTLFYWVEWLIPAHMILAGLFAFWLLRRMGLRHPAALLGAAVYQLGAYFASQPQHLGAICAGAWLPLAILAVFEIRVRVRLCWIAALAMAVAMSILAGFVASTEVVAGAVLLFVVALLVSREASWRIVPAVAAGFLWGAAIAAVELIPMWQLARSSMASIRGTWYLYGGGMPLQSLVSLVLPNHYHIFDLEGYKLPYNFTQTYAYCGIATMVLIALAPFVRKSRAVMFLILTVVAAVWMLGEHTPVYRFVFGHLPATLRGSLYAEHALMAFCCFAGITAAIVLDRIGRRVPEAVLWGIALFTCYDLMQAGSGRPMNSSSGGYKKVESESRVPDAPELPDQLRSLVERTSPPSRIDYADAVFSQGIRGSDMLRLPTASGDNPFVLLRILYLRRLIGSGAPWDRLLPVSQFSSPLLSMMNVGWVVGGAPIPADQVEKAGLEPLEPVDGFHVYRNPRVLPRFFLAPRVRRSSGESETLRMVSRADFNPAAEAIVEGLPSDREGLGTGEVKVSAYTANRVQLEVVSTAPAFLATSEAMYPGWEAAVNGKPAPLLTTNGAFRGLALDGGANTVVMEYHPRYFAFSSFLSVLALLAAAAAGFGRERLWRRRTVPKPAG
jgi:hypothetical protein